MKEVPKDKKSSLGKLPEDVRNNMGFMNKGGKVKGYRKGGLNTSTTTKAQSGMKLNAEDKKRRTRFAGATPVPKKRPSRQLGKLKKIRRILKASSGGLLVVDRNYLKGR
tara:strand:+ start:198 stop:524 length:327 start_codon:yes stop_codon:yes gene_type:complete